MKKVLIVGGTSGIGAALARAMLRAGWQVCVTGIEHERLAALEAQAEPRLRCAYFDAAAADADQTLPKLLAGFDPCDCLVYCAGIGQLNRDQPANLQNQANQVNVLAFTTIADFAWRYFDQLGAGHFVNISSIAGLFGYHKAPAYHAAKSYQINYLEALRQKAFQSGKPIYITDIRPGFVDTAITKGKRMIWLISADEAARQILQHIDQRSEIAYVPRRWAVVAWLLQLLPAWLRKRL